MSSLSIDPNKNAKYPVTISEQFLHEDGPRKRHKVNVQRDCSSTYFKAYRANRAIVNHRPKIPSSSIKSIITPSKHGLGHGYNLALANSETGEDYLYTGNQVPSSAIALIYDPNSQSFTLDAIDTEFRFNLYSTPSNKDAARLASLHPQLDTGLQPPSQNEEDDLFDDGANNDNDTEAAADPSNPYDYRHFLKPARSPSPEPTPIPNYNHNLTPALTAASPIYRTSRPSRPKQRPNDKQRPHHKPRHLSPIAREDIADADNEDSDPGDDVLTIDMGESTTNSKPWRSVLGALNEGGRGSGPISLRSAASSMSPSIRGGSDEEIDGKSNADVEELELGNETLEFEDEGAVDEDAADEEAADENAADEDAADEDAADEDAVTPGTGWEDAEGDLEAELEQALENQEEEDGRVEINVSGAHINGVNNGTESARVVEESSEESEEE
ncbi:hypothetical protein MMC28_008000 [Mycoblastus sanguinarius]|nr:hypothetical protein [Mycoblastus sanguinarius]